MAERRFRSLATLFLSLNFFMYVAVVGISAWAINRIIDHGTVGGGENSATLFVAIFSLLAGVIGAASCSFGLNHIRDWGQQSLPAAAAVAGIAWSLTLLALGFSIKQMKLQAGKVDNRLKTLETLIIILSATMFSYICAIHGALRRGNC